MDFEKFFEDEFVKRYETMKRKLGRLAIVEVVKSLLRAVWHTVEIVQCTECHRKYPAFNFMVLHMYPNPADPNDTGASYCRKCYNKIVASPETRLCELYYVRFNPVGAFIDHLEWHWQNEVRRTLLSIKHGKKEGMR